jgi:hypothetical protein
VPQIFTNQVNFLGEKLCFFDARDIQEGEEVVVLQNSCFHIFHYQCYVTWRNGPGRTFLCPKCGNGDFREYKLPR